VVVGLVGCGGWGKHILRDLRTLGCEVPVVARSDASTTRARDGGAAAVVSDVASLPTLDGAVVATSTSTHAAVLDEVLDRGVPVFCEKPLCTDTTDAEQLAAIAPDRLFVMDKWRYHPGVLELAAIARGRRLGTVAGLQTVRVGWSTPHDDVDPVWVLAPHDLAIAVEIMGGVPRPAAAVAQWLDGDVVTLSALLRGDGWWHALEVSGRSPERTRRLELHCSDGVAVLGGGWDEHVTVFTGERGAPEEERIDTPGELPLLAELRAFVEHLRGGPPPKSSAAEGAEIVAAIARLRGLAREP
jgi:predicted dehydrogenase